MVSDHPLSRNESALKKAFFLKNHKAVPDKSFFSRVFLGFRRFFLIFGILLSVLRKSAFLGRFRSCLEGDHWVWSLWKIANQYEFAFPGLQKGWDFGQKALGRMRIDSSPFLASSALSNWLTNWCHVEDRQKSTIYCHPKQNNKPKILAFSPTIPEKCDKNVKLQFPVVQKFPICARKFRFAQESSMM